MFGFTVLEAIVMGTALLGVPLLGAGVVVSFAIPLRNATSPDGVSPAKRSG